MHVLSVCTHVCVHIHVCLYDMTSLLITLTLLEIEKSGSPFLWMYIFEELEDPSTCRRRLGGGGGGGGNEPVLVTTYTIPFSRKPQVH